MRQALGAAKTEIFGSVRERVELEIRRRDYCMGRGYHRIEELNDNDPQICYDCGIFFGRNQGISYRVELED